MTPFYTDDSATLFHGDCLDVLRELPDASVDAVVTDPPYGLEFMGREWDAPWKADGTVLSDPAEVGGFQDGNGGNPYSRSRIRFGTGAGFQDWCQEWATECLRVLKPGGHMLAFGGSRTWHRLTCAIEDAGFEIRDSIAWLYSSGFPKSLNVSKDARFCQCDRGGLRQHGTTQGMDTAEQVGPLDLSDMWGAVSQVTDQAEGHTSPDVLPPMPGQEGRGPTGSDSPSGSSRLDNGTAPHDGREQPGVERRRDLQASEGELRRPEVRPLPTGLPGNGTQGRLHHGAPAGHGSVGGPDAVSDGDGQSHQPRPEGQPAGELGAVSDERRPQAWGGWPVCEQCSQPAIPDGLGTALKPAFEPVVVARKPLSGTVAQTVLAHGTGALNVDGCRVGTDSTRRSNTAEMGYHGGNLAESYETGSVAGRWPSNVVLDESQAAELDRQSGTTGPRQSGWSQSGSKESGNGRMSGKNYDRDPKPDSFINQGGGASRFFPVFATHQQEEPCSQETTEGCTNDATGAAKPQKSMTGRTPEVGGSTTRPPVPPDIGTPDFPTFRYEPKAPTTERPRDGVTAHPTVKPLDLMRWLVRLVTPPGGIVLEPFAGSGTTAEACVVEGFKCVAIEREADYLPLIVQRLTKPIQVALDFD